MAGERSKSPLPVSSFTSQRWMGKQMYQMFYMIHMGVSEQALMVSLKLLGLGVEGKASILSCTCMHNDGLRYM